MRDLNECTAEVFRRSEQRIRERRKNRSRILTVCIPIGLIAAVWSVIIFPPMMLAGEISDRAQVDGESAMRDPESIACPYIAVEIQDAGAFPAEYDGKVTDRSAVAELFGAVNSLFADANGDDWNANGNFPAGDKAPAEDNYANGDLAEASNNRKNCTITFTAEDGSQAVYYLRENTLVNVSTDETVSLSDAQAAGLLAVLGLSE